MPKTSTGISVKSTVTPKGYQPSPNHLTTHVFNGYVNWRRYIMRMDLKKKRSKGAKVIAWTLNKFRTA